MTPTPTSDAPVAVSPELAPYVQNRSFFGHPSGLSTLFMTEMWERFSYYGLRPLLVLFMAAALNDGGFGFERTQAPLGRIGILPARQDRSLRGVSPMAG